MPSDAEFRRQAKQAYDVAYHQRMRSKTAGRSSGPDAFTDHTSEMPDCGESEAWNHGIQDAETALRMQRHHDKPHSKEHKKPQKNKQGWVVSKYIGDTFDLGKPIFGPYEEVFQKIFDASYQETGARLSDLWNGVGSAARIAFGTGWDEHDVAPAFAVYQEAGIRLGISVTSLSGPHIRDQRESTKKQTGETKGIFPLESIAEPFLHAVAWFIRESELQAVEKITMNRGSALLRTYLDEMETYVSMPDTKNSSHIEDAVKRVNMAFSVLKKVTGKDKATIIAELADQYPFEELSERTASIAVGGESEDDVFFGKFEHVASPKRSGVYDTLRKFGGKNIQNKLSQIYESVFDLILTREQDMMTTISSEISGSNWTLTSEGERLFHARKNILEKLFHGPIHGKLVGEVYTTGGDFGMELSTAVIEPLVVGEGIDGEAFPKEVDCVLKIVYPKYDADNNITIYLPPVEEEYFLQRARDALSSQGFHVAKVFGSSENALLMERIFGVSLFDFAFRLVHKKSFSPYQDMIQDAVFEMTLDAQKQLLTAYTSMMGEQAWPFEVDSENGTFFQSRENMDSAISLDVAFREGHTDDPGKKWHGLRNWIVDADNLEYELLRGEGGVETMTVSDMISILKKNTTLIDPVSMVWHGEKTQDFDVPTIDPFTLPRSMLRVAL